MRGFCYACKLHQERVARLTLGEPQRLSAESAEGVEIGEGMSSPQPTMGLGSVMSPGTQRIFGIFESHETLLVKRTVLFLPVFRKKIYSIDDWWGHGPLTPFWLRPSHRSVYYRSRLLINTFNACESGCVGTHVVNKRYRQT